MVSKKRKSGRKTDKSRVKVHSKVNLRSKKNPDSKKESGSSSLKDALHQLEIMAEEKKTGAKVEEVEKKEEHIGKVEARIAKEEKNIEQDTKKIAKMEKHIEIEVTPKPLTKFGIKDINKGIIGAFIGVVAHFGFIYGKAIAENLSTARATLIIVFSYVMVVILMYETGYREIKEAKLLGILPKRATIVFATSIGVIVVIFFLFNLINLSDPLGLYKAVAVTSVLASLGAGTADLIGRD